MVSNLEILQEKIEKRKKKEWRKATFVFGERLLDFVPEIPLAEACSCSEFIKLFFNSYHYDIIDKLIWCKCMWEHSVGNTLQAAKTQS